MIMVFSDVKSFFSGGAMVKSPPASAGDVRDVGSFELWCWRTLLRVPWTARRSNPSILKEINPGISLEGMMLKLKPVLWPPHANS